MKKEMFVTLLCGFMVNSCSSRSIQKDSESLAISGQKQGEVGVFWGDMRAEPVNFHELKSWGITDFYLTNKYIRVSDIEDTALEAKKAGLNFHLWYEQGLHQGLVFRGTQDVSESLWLRTVPFGKPNFSKSPLCREKQHDKAFLDIENPAARKAFIDAISIYARLEGMSSITLDDHTSFFMGPDGSNLPCLADGRKEDLKEALTSLVNETASELKKSGIKTELFLAHNPAAWAKRTALADWTKWNIPRKNVQTYVSRAIINEIDIAKGQNVSSVTLFAASPDTVDNVKKVLQTKMGLILFKLPAPETKKSLAPLFRGISQVPEPIAFEKAPSQCPFVANFVGFNELLSKCSKAAVNSRIDAKLTNCQKVSCKAIGGGDACENSSQFSKAFLCNSLLPRHTGRTQAEIEKLLEVYKVNGF